MNKTDLLKQIAKAITKAAKRVDPKVAANTTKVTSALAGARLVDDLVLDKIPGLKSAMRWADDKITAGQQWLVDNTLGKIPGVGPIISRLHKGGSDVRIKIRNAMFGDNHPNWYEHLPQHVPFTIPGSYNNKTIQLITGNSAKTAIPSVATINMLRNIVTTPYATTSRYSEIYTAVKYARGLSYLPYSVNQLALMFEIGNEMTVLYYKVAKAVCSAFHYTLTKANLPERIISGLYIQDLIPNYAEYVTLLDQMYNYMSVNVPLLPIMHNKLKQMNLFTALDSEKPAMSTYIQANVRINRIRVSDDGEGFYTNNVDTPKVVADFREIFQYYVNLLSAGTGATSQLLNVIADVKGSITSVSYVDNWRNIKFEDTITSDPLFLNSIKNMDLIPTFGIVGSAQGSDFGFVCDDFVYAYQGTSSAPIKVSTGNVASINLRYGSATNVGFDNFTAKYICCSGSKEIKPFARAVSEQAPSYSYDLTQDEYRFTNKLVSLDGTEDTEGKVLETISLNFVTTNCVLEVPNKNTPAYVTIVVNPSLFVGISIDISNGYSDTETKRLRNILNIPGWTLQDIVYSTCTSWSVVDWMPAIRVTTFVGANQYYTAQLWDINGIGSLSYNSIETAIDYITYSLLYPGDVEALNKIELANKLISSLHSK